MLNSLWSGPHCGRKFEDPNLLKAELNEVSGVYLWRKVFRTDTSVFDSEEDMLSWINRTSCSPLLSTDSLRLKNPGTGKLSIRQNYAQIEKLVIGKGSLLEKEEQLKSLLRDDATKRWIYELLRESSYSFGPILYVGESGDLFARFRSHVGSSSDLLKKLQELDLELEDVAFFYLKLPGLNKASRSVVESIFTHSFNAPLTYRAG